MVRPSNSKKSPPTLFLKYISLSSAPPGGLQFSIFPSSDPTVPLLTVFIETGISVPGSLARFTGSGNPGPESQNANTSLNSVQLYS
jgi:hypothetical protein